MSILWSLRDLNQRPMAVAGPEHVGRFAWSEYWRRWDEILACRVSEFGLSIWLVRDLDEHRSREHSTTIPLDCIKDVPNVVEGRHLPPQETSLRAAA